jgi:hypothetical protein
MSITIREDILFPVRRDKQIAGNIGSVVGGGSNIGGGTTGTTIEGVSYAYVDGSLYARDVSINWLDVNKVDRSGDTMYGELEMIENARIKADFIDSSTAFFSGFAGSGMQMANDNTGDFNATFDNLTVRKLMKVYELQIQKISSVNGGIIVSAANGKAYNVSGNKIYFDENGTHNQIQFANNDYIRAQEWLSDGTNYYLGQVVGDPVHDVSLGGAYITVTNVSGTCWIGAELVQVGNSTDTARQNIIYLTAADDNNPYIDILAGIDAGTFAGKTKVRVGNLSGITDTDFSPDPLTGYGFYANGDVYLKGTVQLVNSIPASPIATNPIWTNIDPSHGKPEDNATLGATWGVNMTPPKRFAETPDGSGLVMTADHMGYYNDGDWQSYIDNNGNTKFIGVTELGTSPQTIAGVDGALAIKGQYIWENYHDGDSALWINPFSYHGTTDHWRDLIISDGKGNYIAKFDSGLGNRRHLDINQDLVVDGSTTIGSCLTVSGNDSTDTATKLYNGTFLSGALVRNHTHLSSGTNLILVNSSYSLIICADNATAKGIYLPIDPIEGMEFTIINQGTGHVTVIGYNTGASEGKYMLSEGVVVDGVVLTDYLTLQVIFGGVYWSII